jgi:hypothetical protein
MSILQIFPRGLLTRERVERRKRRRMRKKTGTEDCMESIKSKKKKSKDIFFGSRGNQSRRIMTKGFSNDQN